MGRQEASELWKQNELLKGVYDFSESVSVSNAAAPGTLIRQTRGLNLNITDIIIYNPAGVAAEITFYDEDSNVKLPVTIGNAETAAIDLKSSIVYGKHSIYARTDNAINAKITIAGKES